jgi:hypothetical protein
MARDVATNFACLASMRVSLRQLLDEIRTEINVINAALSELRPRPQRPIFEGDVGVKVGSYLGGTPFFGRDVNVFETSQGMLILPAITGIKTDPTENPRVRRVSELGEFMMNDRVRRFFTDEGTVSRGQFIAKFGEEELKSGVKVQDVLDILPGTASFSSPDAMLNGVATREGAAIRTSAIESESIAASLGIARGESIADAPVDRIDAIPVGTRTALVAAGVISVGDLAGGETAGIATALREKGVDVTEGEVARLVATAKALASIR